MGCGFLEIKIFKANVEKIVQCPNRPPYLSVSVHLFTKLLSLTLCSRRDRLSPYVNLIVNINDRRSRVFAIYHVYQPAWPFGAWSDQGNQMSSPFDFTPRRKIFLLPHAATVTTIIDMQLWHSEIFFLIALPCSGPILIHKGISRDHWTMSVVDLSVKVTWGHKLNMEPYGSESVNSLYPIYVLS